jgi:CRISPR-associated protein Csb1
MVVMTIEYEKLERVPRLLMEAQLKPLQGARFQPTGFPDLGAARYTVPDGTEMLLVESAQSVANRMELACWDEADDDLIPQLRGLPYILVKQPDGKKLTNSILEAHRINSPYILEGEDKKVFDLLKTWVAGMEIGPVKISELARLVFKYDANAVLHGVFLPKKDLAGGRLRMTRLLTGFIEARNVRVAESGGVKNDRVDPRGEAATGFGHVPFSRTEFTAENIRAYFNFDLAFLRGYNLGENATKLLIALGLFKVRRFLSSGLRLRTACDLDVVGDIVVKRPEGFSVPQEDVLLAECERLIRTCADENLFAKPPITEVIWRYEKRKKKDADAEGESSGS